MVQSSPEESDEESRTDQCREGLIAVESEIPSIKQRDCQLRIYKLFVGVVHFMWVSLVERYTLIRNLSFIRRKRDNVYEPN